MILYFADRQLNIIGQASTHLPDGIHIKDDTKTEDVSLGVSIFEATIPFDDATRLQVEKCTAVGNYLLRSHDGECELYSIIDTEADTKKHEVYFYAEDAGMDLLNEVVGAYEADKAYPITHYVSKYASSAGFKVGVNEVSSLTRKLSWDGEATAQERLLSVAEGFGNCELSFSFDVDGLYVRNKYINIYKKRGKDIGTPLRLNIEVDSIRTTKSIANLATALQCEGGMIEQESTVLTKKISSAPNIEYKLDLYTEGRTASTVNLKAMVSAELTNENAVLGEDYGLKASVSVGGVWHSATLKATTGDDKTEWRGGTSHSVEFTFTVSGVAAGVVTFEDIKFKVERTDSKGGSAGVLASTNCEKFIVANYVTGGENGEDIINRAITIEGFKYDDGDFYVEGSVLKSRTALKNWARLLWKDDGTQKAGGHITKQYSYDTFSQEELCNRAITELKKAREMEVNYEAEIKELPANIKIGDRVNLIDDKGELYLNTRLLTIETSVADKMRRAVFGEFKIKSSGISQKVADLASEFAVKAAETAKALAAAAAAEKASKNASSKVDDLETRANSGEFKGEDATTLRIDSSRGTVFKNSEVSTVLSAVIYKGSKRITDITALKAEYGASAYLEWSWQRMNDSAFGVIVASDSRIGQDGFTLTLTPEDVDTKVVFMCQLITE